MAAARPCAKQPSIQVTQIRLGSTRQHRQEQRIDMWDKIHGWRDEERRIVALQTAFSCKCSDMTVRIARVQSEKTYQRTTARRHLANTIVPPVGDEHIAARIDSNATGIKKNSIGTRSVRRRPRKIASPCERCDHCTLRTNSQVNKHSTNNQTQTKSHEHTRTH